MKPSRWILSIVVIVALALSVAPVSPAQAAPSKPHIGWGPCYKESGNFECGTMQVPINYSDPTFGAISIAVIRLPATDRVNRIGSLFFNPGGPGGSGVDFIRDAGPYLYTPEVRERYDLVGFDPRGIARSTAFHCFGNFKQLSPYFLPFLFPMTPEETGQLEAADRYVDSACEQHGSKLMDYMSSGNVARDLDMLRQAVGDAKLNYVGLSYGTFIGHVYAELFPGNVGAMVLDGVVDPVAWAANDTSNPPYIRQGTHLSSMATLGEFFRLCDEYPDTCGFSGETPSADRYEEIAEKLKVSPVVLPTPDGSEVFFSYANLVAETQFAMYVSDNWPMFAGFMGWLEDILAEQDGVAGQSQTLRGEVPGLIARRGPSKYPNYVESFAGVACADSINPDNYPALSDAADEAEGYFGRLWVWAYGASVCTEWPGGNNGRYTGSFNASTTSPVLVVGNRYDPVTSYQNAVDAANRLPNAELLTLNGWGHLSLFLSQCIDVHVADYLLNGTLPPDGSTECDPDRIPFHDQATALSDSAQKGLQARLSVLESLIPEPLVKGGRGSR
jgi:pimeloyl-ACP methyl ester carboxylesterase